MSEALATVYLTTLEWCQTAALNMVIKLNRHLKETTLLEIIHHKEILPPNYHRRPNVFSISGKETQRDPAPRQTFLSRPDPFRVSAPHSLTLLLLLTRRPRSCFVPGPRPAVGEGEPDGEDGGVGVVCYPWGSHVGRGSDCHGVGPRCVAATVLKPRRGRGTQETFYQHLRQINEDLVIQMTLETQQRAA